MSDPSAVRPRELAAPMRILDYWFAVPGQSHPRSVGGVGGRSDCMVNASAVQILLAIYSS